MLNLTTVATVSDLTKRQKEALSFIQGKQRRAGPTINELAKHLRVFPFAAQRLITKLREAGELEPESGDGLVVKPDYSRAIEHLEAVARHRERMERTAIPARKPIYGGCLKKPKA